MRSGSTELDVLVIGAGPAGCAAGLALAGHGRVVVVDRVEEPTPRIGESLIPAARALLRDLGALDLVETAGHLPYFGNRSLWGADAVRETDFLRDPCGPGWHLDRAAFEVGLRERLMERGVEVWSPAKAQTMKATDAGWRVAVEVNGESQQIHARMLVDATGRSARVARMAGGRLRSMDRLAAAWAYGSVERECGETLGFSYIESEPNGWWYSAPVPGPDASHSRRVLAYHTDVDLMPQSVRTAHGMEESARRLPGLGALLDRVGFRCERSPRLTAANSACMSSPAGSGWIAVGDAALSLDPLASRGVFQALYTGFKGGVACRRHLSGESGALLDYGAELERLRAAYGRQMTLAYGSERRWAGMAFWSRRHALVR